MHDLAAPAEPRYSVFISHSTSLNADQRQLINQLVHELEKWGHTVFIDRFCLASGEPLIPALDNAIEGSRVGLIILTKRALESCFVELEMQKMREQAIKGRMRLLCVRVEESCPLPSSLFDLEVCELRGLGDLGGTADRIRELLP